MELVFQGEVARYAALHWPYHIRLTLKHAHSNPLRYDLPALISFAAQSVKTWFNTILNVGKYREVEPALTALIEQAKVGPPSVQT